MVAINTLADAQDEIKRLGGMAQVFALFRSAYSGGQRTQPVKDAVHLIEQISQYATYEPKQATPPHPDIDAFEQMSFVIRQWFVIDHVKAARRCERMQARMATGDFDTENDANQLRNGVLEMYAYMRDLGVRWEMITPAEGVALGEAIANLQQAAAVRAQTLSGHDREALLKVSTHALSLTQVQARVQQTLTDTQLDPHTNAPVTPDAFFGNMEAIRVYNYVLQSLARLESLEVVSAVDLKTLNGQIADIAANTQAYANANAPAIMDDKGTLEDRQRLTMLRRVANGRLREAAETNVAGVLSLHRAALPAQAAAVIP